MLAKHDTIHLVQCELGFIYEEDTCPECQTPSKVSFCPLKLVTATNYSRVKTPVTMTSMQMSEMVSNSSAGKNFGCAKQLLHQLSVLRQMCLYHFPNSQTQK